MYRHSPEVAALENGMLTTYSLVQHTCNSNEYDLFAMDRVCTTLGRAAAVCQVAVKT